MVYFNNKIVDSNVPYRNVRCIQFGVLSPDEIVRMSVTNPPIKYPQLMEGGRPKQGGPIDPRLGPLDRKSQCKTCQSSYNQCPGHFGHIQLIKPVYHVSFLSKILKILRCICYHCSKLLIDPHNEKIIEIIRTTEGKHYQRFNSIYNICKRQEICIETENKSFNSCGRHQPKYSRSDLHLYIQWKQQSKMKLSVEDVLSILKKIPNSICHILGMDPRYVRPDWMIITVLPVLPIVIEFYAKCIRPLVLLRNHDDLTYNLQNILKANEILREDIACGASAHIIEADIHCLQYCCSKLIENRICIKSQLCYQNRKSIKDRLQDRICNHLKSKSVYFTGQTIVTSDPNLAIDQIGVPHTIANDLTVPEIVTPFNIKWLEELIHLNAVKYIIKRDTNQRIDLRSYRKPSHLQLQYGYIVERYMMNDDLVAVTRHSTDNKTSMMGYRVKILPWSTFRLNYLLTTSLSNDRIVLHLPQSVETKTEVSQLMMVPRLITYPYLNRSRITISHDILTGITKMTHRDVFIEKSHFMDLLMQISSWNGYVPQATILKPKPLWTGKQLFSLILPEEISYIGTHVHHPCDEDDGSFKWISPADTKVIIENGRLLLGIVCKRTLSTKMKSLVNLMFMECGYHIVSQFSNHIQIIVNNWLMLEGYSIGIADIIIDQETYNKIDILINRTKNDVHKVLVKVYKDSLEPSPGNSLIQTFDNMVDSLFLQCRYCSRSLVQKSLSNLNQSKTMIVNLDQQSTFRILNATTCIGQQYVEEKRIHFGFKHRTLPHFVKDDYGPESKGFIENSYLQGLTPTEFYFHAMHQRDYFVNKIFKQININYIEKHLIKSLETIMIKYDGTVRNQDEQIIQFIYGDDGLNEEYLENQSIISLKPANKVFENSCKFNLSAGENDLRKYLTDDVLTDLYTNESLQILDDEWKQLNEDRLNLRQIFPSGNTSNIFLPCNLERLIYKTKKKFNISNHTQSNFSPIKVIETLEKLIERLIIISGNNLLSQYNSTMLFNILLRSSLSSRQVLQFHHLTNEAFDWLCYQIEKRFQQSQIQPSEMVGITAAQSIIKPSRIIILYAFIYGGVSKKNVTLGIPRLREILHLSKKPKTPSLTVYLTGQARNEAEKCQQVLNRLEHCTLKKVISNTSIYYDPNPQQTVIAEDQKWVNAYYEMPNQNIANISQWLLRIELDRKQMTDKTLTMEQISEKISQHYGHCLNVIFNDDNAEQLVLHIRTVDQSKNEARDDTTRINDVTFLRYLESSMLSNLTLQGIEAISKVYMVNPKVDESKKRIQINENGEIEKIAEWMLETDGTALKKVLAIKDVDSRRTISNDIVEIFDVLGIEAVRKAIQHEINHVISFNGAYVNSRHVALLCDIMTTKGHLMGITKSGINREDLGPIMRCSFKEIADVFIEAAEHAEQDLLKGISDNILLGQLPKIGTGSFDLLLDIQKCTLKL
ncbi:unnamed protein product [Adineta steineri]|uniref:DNA-directed RNA polymerase subunit n=1 Tax=Adineta steineri TaxID=433720 RepID=A0A813PRB6_9BILA|nr:unnamed protein product [Adineta steineri]CAF3772985.1 unnamed protein product [Adineta steineri]